MLEAIRVPAQSASAQWGYYKVCRKTGEYAHAIGAVLLDRPRDVFRAVIGATERKPLVLPDARALFGGSDRSRAIRFRRRRYDAAVDRDDRSARPANPHRGAQRARFDRPGGA